MKTPEDEAFDDLARKQGMWGGGFNAKRQAAMDKINQEFTEEYIKYRTAFPKGYIAPPQQEYVPLVSVAEPALSKYRVEEDDDTQVYKKLWVGLTEDEVKRCGFAVPFDGAQDWALRFSQAIEAKLKEKNA